MELDPGISIVQSDILFGDPAVSEALEREGPFDVVTVWLMGTDILLRRKLDLNPPEYRRYVQLQICEMADRLLRPGGWIQFVDRSKFPLTGDQQNGLLQSHEELLEPTRLRFRSFANRPYEEAGEGGIPMGQSSGPIGHRSRMGLNSIISWLPDEIAER